MLNKYLSIFIVWLNELSCFVLLSFMLLYFLSFRFMVATRDIDPLELILVEEPAVVGPYSKSTNGCLQCFKKVRLATNHFTFLYIQIL